MLSVKRYDQNRFSKDRKRLYKFIMQIGGEGVGGGGSAYATSQTTLLHMKRLNKTEALFFVMLGVFFFVSKGNPLDFLLWDTVFTVIFHCIKNYIGEMGRHYAGWSVSAHIS